MSSKLGAIHLDVSWSASEVLLEQALEGGAIAPREVGHVARIHGEQHFRAAVPHLPGNPLRGFPGCQPERGRRMASLIRTPLAEIEVAEEGIPNPAREVAVADWLPIAIAKDELLAARDLLLCR